MSVTTLAEQKAFFEREGYLILPGFFSADSIDYFQGVIEHVKQLRPFDAVLDDLENGERTVLGLMTPEQVARHRIKLTTCICGFFLSASWRSPSRSSRCWKHCSAMRRPAGICSGQPFAAAAQVQRWQFSCHRERDGGVVRNHVRRRGASRFEDEPFSGEKG